MSEIIVKNVVVHESKKDDRKKLPKKSKETPVVCSSHKDEPRDEKFILPLQQLVPIYLDQILPPETYVYPLMSYERVFGPGYLYMLSESTQFRERGTFYKLGVTNDLKRRLRDIQNGNPRPLIPECLIKVQEMDKINTALEESLGKHKVAQHGGKDWYWAENEEDFKAVLQEIGGIKRRLKGVEIPANSFKDYVNYYIHFDEDI